MAKIIDGVVQTTLDTDAEVPEAGDLTSAARFEAFAQGTLNNIVTLNQLIAGGGSVTVTVADGSINEDKLATDSVTTIKIKDGNITTQKLADDSVGPSKLDTPSDGSTGQVLTRTATGQDWQNIPTVSITDGSLTTAKYADDSITETKLKIRNTGSANQALFFIATDVMEWKDLPVVTIANDTIATAMIQAEAITEDKLDIHSDPADKDVLQYDDTNGMDWGPVEIRDNQVVKSKIAGKAVSVDKLDTPSAGTSGQVFTRTATGADWQTAPASTTIADGSLITVMFADDNITESKLKIRNTGTAGNSLKFVSADIMEWGAPYPAGGIITTLIADGNITKAKMAANSVGTSQLENDSVTFIKLAPDSVITVKIKDGNVTKSKMADNSVGVDELDTTSGGTTGQVLTRTATGQDWQTLPAVTIAAGSIGTTELADDSVSMGKMKNDAVGPNELNLSNASTTAGQYVTIGAGTNNLTAVAAPTLTITAGSIGTTELANKAVTPGKLDTTSAGTTGQVLTRTATGQDWQNIPAVTITAGSIGTTELADDSVSMAKMKNDAVGPNELNLSNTSTSSGQYLTIGAGTNNLTAVDATDSLAWAPNLRSDSTTGVSFDRHSSAATKTGKLVTFWIRGYASSTINGTGRIRNEYFWDLPFSPAEVQTVLGPIARPGVANSTGALAIVRLNRVRLRIDVDGGTSSTTGSFTRAWTTLSGFYLID